MGGVLEQLADGQDLPEPGKEEEIKKIPVGSFSRKLTSGQANTWQIREEEAYVIVTILKAHCSGCYGLSCAAMRWNALSALSTVLQDFHQHRPSATIIVMIGHHHDDDG